MTQATVIATKNLECIVEDTSGNEYCDDDGYANEFMLSGSDQEKSTSAKVQSYKSSLTWNCFDYTAL